MHNEAHGFTCGLVVSLLAFLILTPASAAQIRAGPHVQLWCHQHASMLVMDAPGTPLLPPCESQHFDQQLEHPNTALQDLLEAGSFLICYHLQYM